MISKQKLNTLIGDIKSEKDILVDVAVGLNSFDFTKDMSDKIWKIVDNLNGICIGLSFVLENWCSNEE